MSGIDSLLNGLRSAYAAINEVEEVAARFPADQFVLANLTSLKRDAENLEKLWEQACLNSQVEICRYKLQPEGHQRFTLESVTKSLLDFQELFSQIFDALSYGVKKRARLSEETIRDTAFDFGFSYPGSLGVALMVNSERGLFFGKFDKTVDTFSQLLNVSDEFEVRDIAKLLGGAVVKKAYDWSRTNYFSGYGVDLTWNTVDGSRKGGFINVTSLGRIVQIIEKTSDIERSDLTLRGTLVGIDTVRKQFHFVEPNGADYRGALGDEFPIKQEWAVNRAYDSLIRVETTIEYATQEEKRSYKLINLSPIPNSK